jgi:S-adenosyl methyltransferase
VSQPRTTSDEQLPAFDPRVPSPARMWNFWLGGKDNFAADREAGQRVLEVLPSMPVIARFARLFLVDAVTRLADGHGIRQFLDIGTGLPTADNTHDVAQRVAAEARIVYADYDPVVLTHAKALLTSSPEGKTDYIQADLRDTDTILAGAARTLDLTQPVAVILIAVLQLPGDGACGQRHRARGVRGAGRALQRDVLGVDHPAQPRAGSQILRRPGPDPSRSGTHQRVGLAQPDRHHRRRPHRLLRYRQEAVTDRRIRLPQHEGRPDVTESGWGNHRMDM